MTTERYKEISARMTPEQIALLDVALGIESCLQRNVDRLERIARALEKGLNE